MRMRTSKQKFERQWKNSKEKKQKWKKLPMIERDPTTQYQIILTKSFPKQKLKHTREEEYEKMTPWLGSCKEITSKSYIKVGCHHPPPPPPTISSKFNFTQ